MDRTQDVTKRKQMLLDAVTALTSIVKDATVPANVRLDAIKLVLDIAQNPLVTVTQPE